MVYEAYKYGISYVELVHGTPGPNSFSVRQTVLEFADTLKHVVAGRSFIDGGFMEYPEDYPDDAASTRYRLVENPNPIPQDAEMQLGGLRAKYDSDRNLLEPWFPIKLLMSHVFLPKNAINVDVSVHPTGRIRDDNCLIRGVSDEQVFEAVRQVAPEAIVANPQSPPTLAISFLTREQYNLVLSFIKQSLLERSLLSIREVAADFGDNSNRFLNQWYFENRLGTGGALVALSDVTPHGGVTTSEYVPIHRITHIAKAAGLVYPRSKMETPSRSVVSEISEFISKLFGR